MEAQNKMPAVIPTPSGTMTTKEQLTAKEIQVSNETAIAAVTTKARAEIEAAYVMAKKFPRNEEDARIKVLKTCRIPSFAEKAKYKKPQGKVQNEKGQWVQNYIIGPSIRLAEEMSRQWGNLDVEMTILYEDARKRLVQIRAIDLETGSTGRAQFVIDKTVERKSAFGRVVVDERVNSSGEKVSIVVATEDEILSKQNAMASKYRRNLILQLIPAYVLADSLETIDETVKTGIKGDPDKAKKSVADNYSKVGILPSQIEKYLGHPLAQLTTDEIAELKDLYNSIVEGETTWAEIQQEKENQSVDKAAHVQAENDIEKSWDAGVKTGDPATHTHPGAQQAVPQKEK